VVITNRVEILKKYRRHILCVSQNLKEFGVAESKLKVILCSGPSLRWLQGNNKISHFMKSNELEFWEIVIHIALHVSVKFQKDSRSYVSGVASQSCYTKSLHWEDIKTNFWSGANITWENLKGVWRLASANTSSRTS
jgi:hypothetical protein